VSAPDAGFEVDTNRAILLNSDGTAEELPVLPKTELATTILDRVQNRLAPRAPQERHP
jgi:phosphopantothenoylcysteine decarboxylase/phosphopantothenate--cysteine ligase